MESEPLHILLKFDRWATDRLFSTCKSLSDAELDTEFPIGMRSLRRTLAHVASQSGASLLFKPNIQALGDIDDNLGGWHHGHPRSGQTLPLIKYCIVPLIPGALAS